MSAKLFVGNLDYSVTTDDLREHFSNVGTILDCVVVMDRYTGRSRGFGFVEYESEDDANKAIEEKNDTDLKGRNIRVSIAKPSERSGGDDGGSSRGEEAVESSEESEEEQEADDAEEATETTEEAEESEEQEDSKD